MWGYCTDAQTGAFSWIDREAARALGYDTEDQLLASGKTSTDFYAVPAQRQRLLARLREHPDRVASADITVWRENGYRVKVRISAMLARDEGDREIVLGLLQDFGPLVGVDQEARDRVADLLEELGYAHFAADTAGRTIRTSEKERELLGNPPDGALLFQPRDHWWARPAERERFVRALWDNGEVTDYPVLFKTWTGGLRWIDGSCHVVRNISGRAVEIEGIYRDATRAVFQNRLSIALSAVGACSLGIDGTAFIVARTAMELIDAPACAVMLWDRPGEHVFPLHVERVSGTWSPESSDDCVVRASAAAWLAGLRASGTYGKIPGDLARPAVRALFGAAADTMRDLHVFPIFDHERGEGRKVVGHLWLPLSEELSFPFQELQDEIDVFCTVCSTQLRQADLRDGSRLVHDLLQQRSQIRSLDDLDKELDLARELLTECIPVRECAIFRVGVGNERERLFRVRGAGKGGPISLDGRPRRQVRDLARGLTGSVASGPHPFVTLDASTDPRFQQDDTDTPSAGAAGPWVAIPMRSRLGKPLGVIRCVHRLTGDAGLTVTGFGPFDLRVLTEFAQACALLTELAIAESERSQILRRIMHEISTPAELLRENASFARRRRGLSPLVTARLADLELDAEMLLAQVREVDFLIERRVVRIPESPRRVSIEELIRRTFYQFMGELRARGFPPASVKFFDLDILPVLWAQKTALAQIVFNLFRNAVKYAHADPGRFRLDIRASVSLDGARYEICFADFGIGVDEVYRERIFEEEFRAPNARKHVVSGLGLGLTLSRSSARDMGGDLVLRGCRGPTEIVLILPAVLPRDRARRPSVEPPQ